MTQEQVFTYVLTSTEPSVRIASVVLIAMAGLGITLSFIGIVLTFLG